MTIILETKRLVLKTMTAKDLACLFNLRSNPRVMKFIGNGKVQKKEQVKEFIKLAPNYFKEYGLGFFNAFKKENGSFIGQAGLFHLGFDVNQPEIELAYRLLPEYWHQGYATELATALIKWGFNEKKLKRIIAMVHPENERSRRVLEKSGMSYLGMINFREERNPCYEIKKTIIFSDRIKLQPASIDDYPIIQNMTSYYAYDVSEYMQWPMEETGVCDIGLNYLRYFNKENTYPFLIRYDGELAGFAIIDKEVSDSNNDYNMAQFFIIRKFKGCGLGRQIAFQCFNQFPGRWEVFVMPGNEGAYRFWRKIVSEYTNHNFHEVSREVNQYPRNIFIFKSSKLKK
ncbi:GNAT family acetyltransferase [Legionella busanensis]|uniref:GNAT family acetyltransferase n=1 Tax=Legionella busanensis TaxID=190655 RepID=A0A378JIH0_9GAMM|nr:GNAT family N-acetyltransferase [Legionella busanensis]STX50944.1 GNAT family acetyltransferase [Legionella busanensis]